MTFKRSLLITSELALIAGLGLTSCQQQEEEKSDQMNVLFIAVDDLRPELNCYGQSQIHSPNIDRLASQGTQFNRAYCNIAVSGASRASLLTGLRPTQHRFTTYYTWADSVAPDVTCMPQHFKNHGYTSISNGKVFHHQEDRLESWSEQWYPEVKNSWRDYQDPKNIKAQKNGSGSAFESLELPDTSYFDGKIAEKTITDLKKLKESGEPFFLAAGFLKPHLPFTAPQKYWDLYERDNIQLPENDYPPQNAPKRALHNWGELRSYNDIPQKGPVTDEMARKLIHGYYACVSYTDAQIGKLLDALEALELDKNTMVVLFGDHGWNLREHGLWCKHSVFRTSTHTPLIIQVPGMTKGKQSEALVEFVDIYPTLCDLTGLDKPEHLQGESMMSLLKDPYAEWNNPVISRWKDGFTIKTDRYAYTEWVRKSDNQMMNKMLYDHQNDIEENINVADKPKYAPVVRKLSDSLRNNWGEHFDN